MKIFNKYLRNSIYNTQNCGIKVFAKECQIIAKNGLSNLNCAYIINCPSATIIMYSFVDLHSI